MIDRDAFIEGCKIIADAIIKLSETISDLKPVSAKPTAPADIEAILRKGLDPQITDNIIVD